MISLTCRYCAHWSHAKDLALALLADGDELDALTGVCGVSLATLALPSPVWDPVKVAMSVRFGRSTCRSWEMRPHADEDCGPRYFDTDEPRFRGKWRVDGDDT